MSTDYRCLWTVSIIQQVRVVESNSSSVRTVLDVELKHCLQRYLAKDTYGSSVHSLSDIIRHNKESPRVSGLIHGYRQDFLVRASGLPLGMASRNYTDARRRLRATLHPVQSLMARHGVNVLLVVSESDTIPYAPASLAGLPIISLPAGVSSSGFPFGISLYALPHAECQLLRLAQAIEDTSPPRRFPPTFL